MKKIKEAALGAYGKLRDAYRGHGRITAAAAYISIAAVYARFFFNSTMFDTLIRDMHTVDALSFAAYGVLGVSAGLAAIFGEDRRGSALQLIMLLSAAACYLCTKRTDMMMFLVAASAMKGRDPRPFLISSLIIGWGMMLSAYFASVNGYIPYLVYEGKGGIPGMAGHAFGMIYRTDFSAHVLFMVMAYCALRGFRMRVFEYMLQWVPVWFCWRYTGALAAALCMVVFLVLFALLWGYACFRRHIPRATPWTAAVHPLCALGSLAAVRICGSSLPGGLEGKSQTFMSRLSMSHRAFSELPLKPFGQDITERGAGGIPDISQPYFFLDIAYVRILIIYGVVLFIIYLAVMARASYRCARHGELVFALALAVTAVDAVAEHHAMDISYNVFVVLAFSRLREGIPAPMREGDGITRSTGRAF